MSKLDLKKTIPSYKGKAGRIDIVDVPAMRYLMIDGDGGPASQSFADAIQSLYPIAYKLKFSSKLDLEKDYVVPPLEALWWADDMSTFTTNLDKAQWLWTAMLMVPDWITEDMVSHAVSEVGAKKDIVSLEKLRFAELDEGTCVQTLHIGAFDDEGPVLKQMHDEFIPANDLEMAGKHHEIYFNDFRKTAPEKLRTLLRQPVQPI